MLSTDSSPEVAEMLLAEAADLQVVDMHGNTALHQVWSHPMIILILFPKGMQKWIGQTRGTIDILWGGHECPKCERE
jgi:hypothetical protein